MLSRRDLRRRSNLRLKTDSTPDWFRRLGKVGPLWCSLLILAFCFAPACIALVGAWVLGHGRTSPTITAAMICCIIASLGAFWIGETLGKFGYSIARTLAPMLFRMAFPLAVCCVIAYLHERRLAKEGFAYYLIAFYLIALAFETLLSVARIRHADFHGEQAVQ